MLRGHVQKNAHLVFIDMEILDFKYVNLIVMTRSSNIIKSLKDTKDHSSVELQNRWLVFGRIIIMSQNPYIKLNTLR